VGVVVVWGLFFFLSFVEVRLLGGRAGWLVAMNTEGVVVVVDDAPI